MNIEPIITQILAAGTIVCGLLLIVFLAISFASYSLKHDFWRSSVLADVVAVLEKYGLLFAFLITAGAAVASLYYSEIVGWAPCTLCWYQRIFIYPSAVVLGIAWRRNDRQIYRYAGPLLLIGATIALYHYLYQNFSFIPTVCRIDGASCKQDYVRAFGFVSIPLMSLVGCLFAWVMVEFAREGDKKWWRFGR
jgi:disulfide bond formation protein DsbB